MAFPENSLGMPFSHPCHSISYMPCQYLSITALKFIKPEKIVLCQNLFYIKNTGQPCYKVESLPHLCESQNS